MSPKISICKTRILAFLLMFLTLIMTMSSCDSSSVKMSRNIKKNADGLYEIYSAEDLVKYRSILEKEMQEDYDNTGHSTDGKSGAILMSDIDMSSVCGEKKGGWRPIGSRCIVDEKYEGELPYPDGSLYSTTFDGNGHTISHLYVNNDFGGGLFFSIWETEVRDLTFSDCSITSKKGQSGTLAAYMIDGLVSNVCVNNTVTVKSEWSLAGGIVGSAEERNYGAKLENCINSSNVSGKSYVGGIAGSGKERTDIISCTNYGNISCDKTDGNWSSVAGGIVGISMGGSYYKGYIKGCINYGSVSADFACGIVGYNSSRVCYCVNAGSFDGWDICSADGVEFSCINVGKVNGTITTEWNDHNCSKSANVPLGSPSLTDGTLLKRMNKLAGGKYWTQGEQFPVWSGLEE